MSSLSAHLRQPAAHGNLRFHPGCPVCRAERLAGVPPGDELLSARTRAGLAAALLATSAAPAMPAVANEPDSEHEGAATAPAPAGDHDPGFGEGRGDIDLLTDDGPELPLATAEAEVEQAPLRESLPDAVPDAGPGEPAAIPAPPLSATPPAPAEPLPPNDDRAPQVEAMREPVEPAPPQDPPRRLVLKAPGSVSAAPPDAAPMQQVDEPPAVPSIPEPTAADSAGGTQSHSHDRAPAATASRNRPAPRVHVVRQGESLWEIASDRIGGNPAPAQVARLVNRLWELNRDRIGTGDPDLLMAGTELRMP